MSAECGWCQHPVADGPEHVAFLHTHRFDPKRCIECLTCDERVKDATT